MGTIKQRLKAIIERFKIDIGRKNKKLLIAAVLLFFISLSIYNPVKGIEKIILPVLSENKPALIKENTKEESTSFANEFLSNSNFLTANSLASLNNQPSAQKNQPFENVGLALATFQEAALLNQTSPLTFISQEDRDGVVSYIVQEGDTISSIAASFGITINTLLWANKLKETSIIRPGDELIILPISGVLHRVKNGETVGNIATKYKANTEKIIAFNDLPADGAIQVGQKLIIPDGQMPRPVSRSIRIVKNYTVGPGSGKSRSFPYGQCTWYVAQKRVVPWSGHAKSWLTNARAYGYQIGTTPRVGAIVVLTEGGWLGRLYGHVAYVESVNGSWFTISEMNYTCYACKSVRTLKTNDPRIRGYIY
jgi:LysM repeat protein